MFSGLGRYHIFWSTSIQSCCQSIFLTCDLEDFAWSQLTFLWPSFSLICQNKLLIFSVSRTEGLYTAYALFVWYHTIASCFRQLMMKGFWHPHVSMLVCFLPLFWEALALTYKSIYHLVFPLYLSLIEPLSLEKAWQQSGDWCACHTDYQYLVVFVFSLTYLSQLPSALYWTGRSLGQRLSLSFWVCSLAGIQKRLLISTTG